MKYNPKRTNIAIEIVAFFLFLGVLLFLICVQALIAVLNRITEVPQDWSNEYARR